MAPIIYDPRHTTGVSPVHKDVKHPLVYDPRRPGQRGPLHGNRGRGRTLLGLFIFLAFLLVVLAGAAWWLLGATADSASQ